MDTSISWLMDGVDIEQGTLIAQATDKLNGSTQSRNSLGGILGDFCLKRVNGNKRESPKNLI